VNAAILAGGQATRYSGVPKGLLHVGGRRILDRLVTACQEAFGAAPLLVANAPEAPGWRPDLRVVRDRRPGAGTLGGLYTALLEAPAPVICLAWDMPFVPSRLLQRLAQGLADHDVVLPASDSRRGVEPLCAAYGPACVTPVERCLEAGDFRAVAFHHAGRLGILPVEALRPYGDPERLFFNVNTPEDLARADELDA